MAALQIRRGLAANRTSIIPAEGELIYTTDTELLYIGDGVTAGGNPITSGASGTVTSVAVSGGTTGLTTSGGPVTSSGTITLAGTLAVANGGTGATTLTGYVKADGTSAFTAASTIPGSDISGNISGNAANVTGTVAIANGGTGQTTASTAFAALAPSQTGNTGKYLTTDGTTISWAAVDSLPAQTNNTNKVLTTNGTAASWDNVGVDYVVYVTQGGNDTTGDGSITSPFLTIGAALSYAATTWPVVDGSAARVVINIAPGLYTESFTISRPSTHLVGAEGKLKTVMISGTITISPSVSTGGIFQTNISLNNMFVSGNAGSAVVLAGTIQCSVDLNNCYLYTEGSTGAGFLVTSTASGGNRIRINSCDITTVGNTLAIDISNTTNCVILNGTISSASTTDAVKLNGTITVSMIQLVSSTATNLINVAGGTVNIGYSAFTNSAANSNGVTIAAGATYVAGDNVYNIVAGTGRAVTGSAGSAYVRGGNSYLPGSNTGIGASVTVLNMSGEVPVASLIGTVGATQGGTGTSTYATGDLLYASAANTLAKRTIGTTGQVLTVSGGVPTWADASASAAGTLTGTTLASNVVSSSLTSVGTLTSLTLSGSTTFGTNYTETRTNVTAAASTTLDCSLGNIFNITMAASITTLTLSNVPAAGRVYSMTLFVNQDAGGSKTIAWPPAVRWSGGTAPTLTTTGNKTDVLTLVTHDGGTVWYGFTAGLNY